jgi:hypothetical protein
VKQALATLVDEGVIASRRGVPAEVVSLPVQDDEPLSLADRIGRVEDALAVLNQRVSAIEGHDSHLSHNDATEP